MDKAENFKFADNHQFNVGIAQKYGVEEAIIIQHFHFWLEKNEANGNNFRDGKYWTFNSAKAFSKIFPYWSAKSIARKLNDMETRGLIISGNYNEDARDRSKWYTLSENVQCIFHICPMDSPKVSNSIPQSVPPLPDSKPDRDADIKESKEKIADTKCQTKFVPPTVEEVRAYCTERGNGIDPEKFIAFYTANGWVQGKAQKPIKNWKAAVVTWESKNRDSDASADHMAKKKGWGGYLC